jgi:hypothetical protein
MKQLKILGYSYVLDLSKKLRDLGGNVGNCDMDNKIMQVANDVDSDMIASTLLHEIIEALNYHLELKLEHRQIMGLEAGLYQALSENGASLDSLILPEVPQQRAIYDFRSMELDGTVNKL